MTIELSLPLTAMLAVASHAGIVWATQREHSRRLDDHDERIHDLEIDNPEEDR